MAEPGVGVDDGRERDACEVVALRDHLRPEEHGPVGRGEPLERSRSAPGFAAVSASSRIRSSSGTRFASSRSSRCVPAPMRASSDEPQSGHASGAASRVPQWWQRRRPSPWRSSATSQFGQRGVAPQARQWSAGATPRRLSSRIAFPPSLGDRAELGQQRRRERVARLAAQVDDLNRRQRAPSRAAEVEPLERSQLSGRGVALP